MDETAEKFVRLVEIMSQLRNKHGCPWDQKQTHRSLRQHLLEETYEVLEAIDEDNYTALREELGDLLLQIIFHAQMASESNVFSINDVIDNINRKLIRRHPHVFGDERVDSAEEQTILWEQTKLKKEGKKSAIDGVPRELPALVRAYRLQSKAATVGFDWPSIKPVWEKLDEEIAELQQAIKNEDKDQIEAEFGDVLFSLVNLSRFLKCHPEDALRRTIEKFMKRFYRIEKAFQAQNRSLQNATLAEMDAVWNDIKNKEKNNAD